MRQFGYFYRDTTGGVTWKRGVPTSGVGLHWTMAFVGKPETGYRSVGILRPGGGDEVFTHPRTIEPGDIELWEIYTSNQEPVSRIPPTPPHDDAVRKLEERYHSIYETVKCLAADSVNWAAHNLVGDRVTKLEARVQWLTDELNGRGEDHTAWKYLPDKADQLHDPDANITMQPGPVADAWGLDLQLDDNAIDGELIPWLTLHDRLIMLPNGHMIVARQSDKLPERGRVYRVMAIHHHVGSRG